MLLFTVFYLHPPFKIFIFYLLCQNVKNNKTKNSVHSTPLPQTRHPQKKLTVTVGEHTQYFPYAHGTQLSLTPCLLNIPQEQGKSHWSNNRLEGYCAHFNGVEIPVMLRYPVGNKARKDFATLPSKLNIAEVAYAHVYYTYQNKRYDAFLFPYYDWRKHLLTMSSLPYAHHPDAHEFADLRILHPELFSGDRAFTALDSVHFVQQFLHAVLCLLNKKWVPLDLKLENITLKQDPGSGFSVRLIDFEDMIPLPNDMPPLKGRASSKLGTVEYLPLECLGSTNSYHWNSSPEALKARLIYTVALTIYLFLFTSAPVGGKASKKDNGLFLAKGSQKYLETHLCNPDKGEDVEIQKQLAMRLDSDPIKRLQNGSLEAFQEALKYRERTLRKENAVAHYFLRSTPTHSSEDFYPAETKEDRYCANPDTAPDASFVTEEKRDSIQEGSSCCWFLCQCLAGLFPSQAIPLPSPS